ncbi:hypothetical protein [Cellulomonas dongxiuzhuiae]|uniref:Uncharacterized protein n=1 Tax=Cellulomonas dongxiuzhuiae TaxID=2819979 RepID=A0ABX8GI67_9CELL|nr:hypothetical protein [Cellulomonas dongxiuzhuiae]MBO3094552.1 hypothetical protein [Cellulomonas dongxiuzhuiae]QWC15572.1 hypothetical protein KKR89_14940 [Cellulomonas dongxiuzhuiae]
MAGGRRASGVGGTPAGLVVVGVLALAACGVGGPPPTAAGSSSVPTSLTSRGPLPSSVTFDVEVAQARSDRVARVVELQVRNTGPVDVSIARARLTSAFVSGESEEGRDVDASRMRRVRVALGAAVCGPAAGDDPRARVELDVTTADGRTGTVTVTPTDETDDLRRIHGEDCAAAAVAAGLRVTLADGLAVRDVDGTSVADVTLLVEPVPGGPRVRIVAVQSTTLLRPLGSTGQWVVDVDSAVPPPDGRLVLATVPARCDLHAIAEDKRGTVLGVQAVVDDVEQPLFYVAASDALRGALYDYVTTACGPATDARTG